MTRELINRIREKYSYKNVEFECYIVGSRGKIENSWDLEILWNNTKWSYIKVGEKDSFSNIGAFFLNEYDEIRNLLEFGNWILTESLVLYDKLMDKLFILPSSYSVAKKMNILAHLLPLIKDCTTVDEIKYIYEHLQATDLCPTKDEVLAKIIADKGALQQQVKELEEKLAEAEKASQKLEAVKALLTKD